MAFQVPDSFIKQSILVTGASGFVGEKLLTKLVEFGCRQVVGTQFTRLVEVPGATLVPVDLRDQRAVDRLFRDLKPKLVFHCAALTDPGFCEREPESAEAAIVHVAEHLISARNKHTPETRLISLSTDMVFNGKGRHYSEADAPTPISVYGRCKAKADAQMLAESATVVLRPALIYGEPSTHHGSFLAWMIQTLAEGKPLRLFSDEYRSPVYVGDLLELMIRAGSQPQTHSLYNVGGAERLSRVEMGEVLCRQFGFSEELILSVTLEAAGLQGTRPADVSLDSSRANQTFGFQPRSFNAGIRLISEKLLQGK